MKKVIFLALIFSACGKSKKAEYSIECECKEGFSGVSYVSAEKDEVVNPVGTFYADDWIGMDKHNAVHVFISCKGKGVSGRIYKDGQVVEQGKSQDTNIEIRYEE